MLKNFQKSIINKEEISDIIDIRGSCTSCSYTGIFRYIGKMGFNDNEFKLYNCPKCHTTLSEYTITINYTDKNVKLKNT